MLEHGGLGKGALGSQEGHFQRLLLRQAGRHDLAEQARDFLVPQRTLVASQGLLQNLRLALRPVEIHRGARGRLGDADALRQARPFVDQRVNPRVDRIDAVANLGQIHARGGCSLF
jgi:hypothetical protein